MTEIQRVFATNLRKLRLERQLTQAQLAQKADTIGNYVMLLENGSKFPSAPMIDRLAGALEVHPTKLFSPVDEPHQHPWNWGDPISPKKTD